MWLWGIASRIIIYVAVRKYQKPYNVLWLVDLSWKCKVPLVLSSFCWNNLWRKSVNCYLQHSSEIKYTRTYFYLLQFFLACISFTIQIWGMPCHWKASLTPSCSIENFSLSSMLELVWTMLVVACRHKNGAVGSLAYVEWSNTSYLILEVWHYIWNTAQRFQRHWLVQFTQLEHADRENHCWHWLKDYENTDHQESPQAKEIDGRCVKVERERCVCGCFMSQERHYHIVFRIHKKAKQQNQHDFMVTWKLKEKVASWSKN